MMFPSWTKQIGFVTRYVWLTNELLLISQNTFISVEYYITVAWTYNGRNDIIVQNTPFKITSDCKNEDTDCDSFSCWLTRAVVYLRAFSRDGTEAMSCSKIKKRWPYWCTKPVLWELNSFSMQTSPFVSAKQYGGLSLEGKHSRGELCACYSL